MQNKYGCISSGIIPKFASVNVEGVTWFQACGLWQEAGYIPVSGDIIFFDWEQDGSPDHVGIVKEVRDGNVFTIEGNSGNMCKEKHYQINSNVIYGYGTPLYD